MLVRWSKTRQDRTVEVIGLLKLGKKWKTIKGFKKREEVV